MEPLSFAEIKELVERRKKHAQKLQKRLTTVFEELLRIEIEIRNIESKLEEPFREPNSLKTPGSNSIRPESSPNELDFVEALEAADWNFTAAARALGVHRNTVSNQMKRLGIQRPSGARSKPHQSRTSGKKLVKRTRKTDDVAARILTALANAPEPLARAEIIERAEIKSSEWDKTIKALVNSGDVIKTGEKRWTRYERNPYT